MIKRALLQLSSGLPWLLVGILSAALWQSSNAEPPPAGAAPQLVSYQGLIAVDGSPHTGNRRPH